MCATAFGSYSPHSRRPIMVLGIPDGHNSRLLSHSLGYAVQPFRILWYSSGDSWGITWSHSWPLSSMLPRTSRRNLVMVKGGEGHIPSLCPQCSWWCHCRRLLRTVSFNVFEQKLPSIQLLHCYDYQVSKVLLVDDVSVLGRQLVAFSSRTLFRNHGWGSKSSANYSGIRR